MSGYYIWGTVSSVFFLSSIPAIVPLILIATENRTNPGVLWASNVIVCGATLLMAQGAVSQYLLLQRSRKRGAVSLPMHLVFYGKDLSGLMFGLQIGDQAWAIIAMHASNVIMRAPIIYTYLRLSSR